MASPKKKPANHNKITRRKPVATDKYGYNYETHLGTETVRQKHTNPNIAAANAQTKRKPKAKAATAKPTRSRSKPPAPATGRKSPKRPSAATKLAKSLAGNSAPGRIARELNKYEISIKKKKKK
jgi:hypothetical protein